ncbi:MAG: DUF5658 family protein [Woeseia sp.]
MPHATTITDNREREDRRHFNWQTVVLGFARSRRRDGRREHEVEPIFSDWHHPWLFFLSVGTMLLSCLDAFLTLLLLDRGAYEANPFMASAMGHSTLIFTVSKMLLTGLGILALVFLSRSRFLNHFRTGILLTGVFSMYACLVCYELVFLMATH